MDPFSCRYDAAPYTKPPICRAGCEACAVSVWAAAMNATLLRMAALLPPPARRLATVQRVATLVQFLKFGVVGTLGFVVDTATVYALRGSLGLYGAGLASYVVAATCTWACNRTWTFRGLGSGAMHRQWATFLAANMVGFILNRGTYAALVTFVPLCAAEPVFATAAGAIVGMFVNFGLSRAVVFR